MTSGPAPIGALPPEPQPDPAREWAEAWLADNPECRLADLSEAVGAVYGDEVGDRAACAVWFADDPESNPHRPLAVVDIPAGQGAASLYLRDGDLYHRGADGRVRRVEYGGWHEAVDAVDALLAAHLPTIAAEEVAGETAQPYPPTTVDALADLIATYLRSGSDGDIIGLAHDLEDALGVEASDALWREAHAIAVPDPLFDTPQITTDDEGRHWRQGREYVAVDVDGELDYQPAAILPTIDTTEDAP